MANPRRRSSAAGSSGMGGGAVLFVGEANRATANSVGAPPGAYAEPSELPEV